jgi:hypothetical protein
MPGYKKGAGKRTKRKGKTADGCSIINYHSCFAYLNL